MLSVYWEYKGVVYFELLSKNKTINSSSTTYVTCRSKEKRPELLNRKEIVLHHYNARLHTSLVTRVKLLSLVGKCRISQQPWLGVIWLQFISKLAKLFRIIKLALMIMIWNRISAGSVFFYWEWPEILRARNHELARKLIKDQWIKWKMI